MEIETLTLVCAALHTVALAVWFAILALPHWWPEAPAAADGWRRPASLVALLTGACWPLLLVASLEGSWGALMESQKVSDVLLGTSFGRIFAMRVVLMLVATGCSLLSSWRRPALRRVELVLAMACIASLAAIGHAAGVSGLIGRIEQATLSLHLMAGAAWVGTLPILFVCLWRLPLEAVRNALRRFSGYGVALVATILATGVVSAGWRLDRVAALWECAYGELLLVKVVLVSAMGACALCNRRCARLDARNEKPGEDRLRAGLRASIGAEAALGLGVVFAAYWLGSSEAPR